MNVGLSIGPLISLIAGILILIIPRGLPNRAVHVDLAPPGPSGERPWSSGGVPFCRGVVRAGHPVMMTARRL